MVTGNFANVMLSTILFIISMGAGAISRSEIDDSNITMSIKEKLIADEVISGLDIKVKTNKGVVFLEGDVKSPSEANEAIELASSTTGVVDVDASKLIIQGSSHPLADSVITAKIKGIYLREKILSDKPIAVAGVHVETIDGVVYLTGKVDTKAQAEDAERLAKAVKGVREIKSSLSVKK